MKAAAVLAATPFHLVFCAGAVTASEPTFGTSGLDQRAPVHVEAKADPCSYTHNPDTETLESGVGLACNNAGVIVANSYLRVFDLDVDHGFAGPVCVDQLRYGVESASGEPTLTFNVACVPHGFGETDFLSRQTIDDGIVGSVAADQPDAQFEFFDQAIEGCCDADTHDMVVEIATEDCVASGDCVNFFPGGAGFQSLRPYYIQAADCGVPEPVNADLITGLGVQQITWVVTACCGEAVPALTIPGVVLVSLLVGGAGSYRLMRRAASRGDASKA
jgi:hypothetical protein